jgi:2-polyprenyl-3-methyl-5-hydroxy-6-metoxy-1,4-benzoquinol methylase
MISVSATSDRDKAGKEYWDQLYVPERRPEAINPRDTSLRNYIARRFHRFFEKNLSAMKDKELLEVGCGGSQYLPYFSKEFGLHVTGLDYSELGCEAAERVLAAEGVAGEIVCANFFDAPQSLAGKFDVVVSMGVVEHFVDTAACIAAIAKLVKPGGVILTTIPNMRGLTGALQKAFDRDLFNKHVPLNREMLLRAHEQAGLIVEECDYFVFNNFFVIAIQPDHPGSFMRRMKVFLARCLHYVSGAIWVFETAFHNVPPIRFVSPFIVCVARTNASPQDVEQDAKI